MRKFVLTFAVVALIAGAASAQVQGHYVNGVEGIKCGSLPPPGWYFRSYNLWYHADHLKNNDGHDVSSPTGVTPGLTLDVVASVERLIWISPYKILGGYYGADIVIPVLYQHVSYRGGDDTKWGVGDINVEPITLSWHGKQWDAAVGFSFYAPTGEVDDDNPVSIGKGWWTFMGTFGGTVYLDPAKTWSASLLARYETHTYSCTRDVRPGDDFHFEWGVGKQLAKVWEVGLAGYCQWQITNDEGGDCTWNRSHHDRVFAAGPEVDYAVPAWKSMFSLRVLKEFGARDRTEGWIAVLTWTKAF